MIDKNEGKNAKEFLKTQLVKNADKKGFNILSLVKKIILTKDTKGRQVLRTIQHTKANEQLIIDGFVGIKWKQHEEALDILDQTPAELSLQIDQIFRTMPVYELTENDKIVLANIDKFVDLSMAEKIDKKDKRCFAYLFGKYVDISVIKNVIKIGLAYDDNFENTTFTTDEEITTAIQFENNNIKAIVLPCRFNEEADQIKIKEQTQNFIGIIKGV